ncbi:MAG: methyltransferase [Halobacteriales archaeon]|nr:methyltransferase [Halobacteriales archaeon]
MRLAGLELEQHAEVYPPAEDSELLLAALDLLDIGPGDAACDVGTGSGLLGLRMAARGARVVAIDINPHAARLARANAARNRLGMAVVQGSLLAPVRGPFDVVTFNPPYLPVQGETRGELPQAWEGGAGGIGWARLFLAGLQRVLGAGGRGLVLLSSLGDQEAFVALALERGLMAVPVAQRKLAWEELQVWRITRSNL